MGRVKDFRETQWKALDGKLCPLNISAKEYVDFDGTPLLVAFVLNGVRLERVITFDEPDDRTLILLLSEMAEETLQMALSAIKESCENVEAAQTEVACQVGV